MDPEKSKARKYAPLVLGLFLLALTLAVIFGAMTMAE